MIKNKQTWIMGKDILFANYILEMLHGEYKDLDQHFFIKDVIYFKAFENTTLVFLVNIKFTIVLHIRFRKLMKLLPGNHFGRHSNSYIVNYHLIKKHLPELCLALNDKTTNGMISRNHLQKYRRIYKLLKVGFGIRRPRKR